MSKSRAARPFAVAAGLALLAGCGSTGTNGVATKGTGTIVGTAEQSVIDADTVHVQGSFAYAGQQIALDMVLVKGKGAQGTVTIGGEHIQLVRLGNDVYVKGDEAFYRSVIAGFGDPSASPSAPASTPATPAPSGTPKSTATTPGDITVNAMQVNYLHIGMADPQFATYASLTDPKQLVDQILTGTGSLQKDGQKNIRGTKTIILKGSHDSYVYVGIDGPPYLFRVLPPGGGTLDFLDYGTPVTLNPPAPAQVVDIAKIRP